MAKCNSRFLASIFKNLPAAQQDASAAETAVASLEWANLENANGGCAVRLESAVAYIFRVTSRSLIIVTTHAEGFARLRRGPRGSQHRCDW